MNLYGDYVRYRKGEVFNIPSLGNLCKILQVKYYSKNMELSVWFPIELVTFNKIPGGLFN